MQSHAFASCPSLCGLVLLVGCATTAGPSGSRRSTRFSPSSPLKVLFFDFRGDGIGERDLQRLDDLVLDALVDARQAETVSARELPEVRDEATKAAFEGDRSPEVLGKRAASLGADYAVTGNIYRVDRRYVFVIDVVDARGHVVDGAGGRVSGDLGALEPVLRAAGDALLRPLPRPEGPPTAGDAARVLSARSGLLDRCYALGLQRTPNLVGRGILAVTLGSSPEPTDVKVVSSSFNDTSVEACMTDAVKSLRFPVLSGETTLNFPVAYVE